MQHKPTTLTATLIVAMVLAPLSGMAQERYPRYNDPPAEGGYPEPPPVLRGPGEYTPVPGPPVRPMEAARPAAWPGGAAPAPAEPKPDIWRKAFPNEKEMDGMVERAKRQALLGMPGGTLWEYHAELPEPPKSKVDDGGLIPFERARMVARVGADAILVSDLLSMLDELVDKNADRLKPEQAEAQRAYLRQQLLTSVTEAEQGIIPGERLTNEQRERENIFRFLLKEQVNLKLVFLDAQKKIPSENFPNVEKQFNKQFEQFELKKLMARYEADSWRDLDQALKARGTSFERVRRESFERNLFHQWLRQQVKFDEEITIEQMRTYYREHPTEFDKAARTRWQMLSVPFAKHLGKDEARAAIVRMGNQALQGADFVAVAKAGNSDSDGQIRDWPDRSARLPREVEKAIEGLPDGQMGPILEDWWGFYIVRVVERIAAYHQPFDEVQSDIREKIKNQRTNEQMQAYLTRLREQTPVWTILDDKPAASRAADRRGTGRPGGS